MTRPPARPVAGLILMLTTLALGTAWGAPRPAAPQTDGASASHARPGEPDRRRRPLSRRRGPGHRRPRRRARPVFQGGGPVHVAAGRPDRALSQAGFPGRAGRAARKRHPLCVRASRRAPAERGRVLCPFRHRHRRVPDGPDGYRRPAGLRDPAPAPERRRERVLFPLRLRSRTSRDSPGAGSSSTSAGTSTPSTSSRGTSTAWPPSR